jgi:2-oxoglutarate dehydrogenase E2 component (dihydrolipoamide succinyltransferase)
MTSRVHLPDLGENVTEGVITRWLKRAGDTVRADEPLLEVATDKVDTEIPAPFAGTITALLAEENMTVAVGAPLAAIDPADPPRQEHPTIRPPEVPTASKVAEPERAEAPPERPVVGRTEKMSRLRQTIANRMVASLRTSAQLTTVVEADVTRLARLRAAHKDAFLRRTGVKLSFLPFFARAAVESVGEHPMLNAAVSPDHTEVTYHGSCHLGIAVDTPRGLLVPVIRDANELSIEGLALAIADLADRARSGKIGVDELNGGTFTVTNTGSRGALFDTPIINQPQSGILGTGTVVERVVPVPDGDGGHAFAVRSMVYLSVSYDHRIVDGADAARFLAAIKTRIEQSDFTGQL